MSSSGPWSHILNGQTSQRQTQVKTKNESQKGTRADAIIQIHHPPDNSPKLIYCQAQVPGLTYQMVKHLKEKLESERETHIS